MGGEAIMRLYVISQNVNNGYDTYDSAVVAANTEAEARRIYPSHDGDSSQKFDEDLHRWYWQAQDGVRHYLKYDSDWVHDIRDVQVRCIGVLKDETITEPCCILASFNAG